MQQYLQLLEKIYKNGMDRGDRTGTGTRSLFGERMQFDLTEGLPVVTTKSVYMKAVIHELIWLLSGDTNIQYLVDNDITIWDGWADEDGDLGPVYGAQWRNAGGMDRQFNELGDTIAYGIEGVDQIAQVIETLKTNPEDRRMIVDSWNVEALDQMKLPPCHMMFQVYSREMTFAELRKTYLSYIPDIVHMQAQELREYLNACELPMRYLDLQMYQRSADMFLGVPFNIASYALLMELLAAQTNHIAHMYTHILGDAHIYQNHFDQVEKQLMRHLRTLPTVELNLNVEDISDYTYDDIKIIGYDPHPTIKAPVSL